MKRRNFFKTLSLLPFIRREVTQPKDTIITEVRMDCQTAGALKTSFPIDEYPIFSGYCPQGAFLYKDKDGKK